MKSCSQQQCTTNVTNENKYLHWDWNLGHSTRCVDDLTTWAIKPFDIGKVKSHSDKCSDSTLASDEMCMASIDKMKTVLFVERCIIT